MTHNYAVFILLFLAAFGCKDAQEEPIPNKAPLEGTYASVGYGHLISITEDTLSILDVQDRFCLTKKRFALSEVADYFGLQNDTLVYSIGYDHYYYTPISWEPAICHIRYSEDQLKDPMLNFEVLAQTFKEHYAYMELNGLDWEAVYQDHKLRITNQTTEVELYKILDSFITTMNDQHGNLDVPDTVYEAAQLAVPKDSIKTYGDFEVASILRKAILQKNLTKDSKVIHWGLIDEQLGYIQINAMMLTAQLELAPDAIEQYGWVGAYFEHMDQLDEFEQFELELMGASKAMEQALKDLAQTDHLVIDLRFNGGGNDEVGLEMLRHFNDSRKDFGTKKARFKNGYSPTIALELEATSSPYLKPVYLLTSPQTGSAAEIFTMASAVLPQFTRIGGATAGATSDMLEKPLPNGWYFGLSNEVYLDQLGKNYENSGYPADITLSYSRDRQDFFRAVALEPGADLDQWKTVIDSSNQ